MFASEFKKRYGLDATIAQDSHLNVSVYLLICTLDPLFHNHRYLIAVVACLGVVDVNRKLRSRWEANLERLAGTVYNSGSGFAMRSNR